MDAWNSIGDVATTFALGNDQRVALERYAELVLAWRAANITAVRGKADVARLLVGEALSLLDVPELRTRGADTWLDLGSGGGVPGLPLAVVMPSVSMTLLDATSRKCAFLREAVVAADVSSRTRVVCARSEHYAAMGSPGREAFSVVIARAVAPLSVLVELAAPLVRPGGVLAASKTGHAASVEVPEAGCAATVCGFGSPVVRTLPRSPLSDAVCVVYEKVRTTRADIPRRAGMATKRPLGDSHGPSPTAGSATIVAAAKGGR